MKILPVISPKGGEGKSTHAANLAGFLADAGFKTLLLDADYSQPTSSSIFALEYEAPTGLYELLMQSVDLGQKDQIISRSVINNLDVIISNDPDELLPTAMLHASDGRLRLKNILQHPLFSQYDAIIIDSKGATGVMAELVVLTATEFVLGVIKPILPDVREFLRGSLRMLTRLQPFENYGIRLPLIQILANSIEGTNLDHDTLNELAHIIEHKRYDTSSLGGRRVYQLLKTRIDLLDIYKLGHVRAQPFTALNIKPPVKALLRHKQCTVWPVSCSLNGMNSLMH